VIGIDFGTATFRAAVFEGGIPRIIRNKEGQAATPSTVAFTDAGELLVGQSAKRHALLHAPGNVFGVKRLIGAKYRSYEVERARPFLPYDLVEAANGDVQVRIGATVRTPTEITCQIFRSLKASAEDYLGEPVEEAFVAVPAAFGHRQREAVREAGLMAGLKVRRLFGEATAAGVTHGFETKNDGCVAVCDFGAGKIDVAILDMADGFFQAHAVRGDARLGGIDLDRRIAEWAIGELQRSVGRMLELEAPALQWLCAAAEDAKCELSTAATSTLVFPAKAVRGTGDRSFEVVLRRDAYEQLTNDMFEDLESVLEHCLGDAGLGPERIDEVRLVGAQARDPRLKQMVRRVFGRTPKRSTDDDVVAMGAAILAGIMMGEVHDCVLLDVAPHTLGVETRGGRFSPLLERNSTIPTRKSGAFTTIADNQTRIEVHVLEGESETAAQNESLGTFELTDLAPEPAGVTQIEVTIEMDAYATVSVAVRDQATGRSQSMVIPPSGNRTAEQVQVMGTESVAPGLMVLPVFRHALGIENVDGTFTPVVKRNSPIPARASRVFTTVADNQTRVEVRVHVLGEEDVYSKSLAQFELADLPLAPKGGSQIEVTFGVDEHSGISVTAEDRASGRSATIVIPAQNDPNWVSGLGAGGDQDPRTGLFPRESERPGHYLPKEERERLHDEYRLAVTRSLEALQTVDPDSGGLNASIAEVEQAARLLAQAMLRP
jgi:molecular chaperone DnaK